MMLIYGNRKTVASFKVVQLQSKKLFEKVVQNAVCANAESEKRPKSFMIEFWCHLMSFFSSSWAEPVWQIIRDPILVVTQFWQNVLLHFDYLRYYFIIFFQTEVWIWQKIFRIPIRAAAFHRIYTDQFALNIINNSTKTIIITIFILENSV